MEKFFEVIKDLVKSLRFILPTIFILGSVYVFYTSFIRNDTKKTIEDIAFITSHIPENLQNTVYYNFNNDTLVYSNSLPLDVKTKVTDNGYLIRSRFNSFMFITESYRNKEEKDYYYVGNKPSKRPYKGVRAYILSFPNIRRSACMALAQVDWRKQTPNFLGISVGRMDENNPKIGTERLSLGLLQGYMDIDYDGPDKSFVANRPLIYREAFKHCRCLLHNKCIVSLKFY